MKGKDKGTVSESERRRRRRGRMDRKREKQVDEEGSKRSLRDGAWVARCIIT